MERESMEFDVVIVGGGPAGMCAAIEAARAGVECILIDEAPALGGQIYRAIPSEFTPGESLRKSSTRKSPITTRPPPKKTGTSRPRALVSS